jgi:hypothetical protein
MGGKTGYTPSFSHLMADLAKESWSNTVLFFFLMAFSGDNDGIFTGKE